MDIWNIVLVGFEVEKRDVLGVPWRSDVRK